MKIVYFFAGLFLLVLGSCNDELVINADYKDITIVYGLLNPQDSIQYIKINKAFLNKDNSALSIARNPDSLYYSDSLIVVLDEIKNNSHQKYIYLYKVKLENKDSGTFAYPEQYLYRTPPSTFIDSSARYNLSITNTKSGKVVKSSTTIVSRYTPIRPSPYPGATVTFYPTMTPYEITWNTGRGTYFYDLTIRMHYTEYKILNPAVKTEVTMDWPLFTYQRTPSLNGNEKMNYQLIGSSFFDFLASNIPVDMSLNRRFGNIEFIFSSGGQDIFYYINVNKPTVGTVQKKPEFTNIVNGYGVFSSRNQDICTLSLSSITINSIITNAKTINLNFVQ